jgi:hypothetical protein
MNIRGVASGNQARIWRPQALRWFFLLALVWAIYIIFGAREFILPVVGFSALMLVLLIDELFFLD